MQTPDSFMPRRSRGALLVEACLALALLSLLMLGIMRGFAHAQLAVARAAAAASSLDATQMQWWLRLARGEMPDDE